MRNLFTFLRNNINYYTGDVNVVYDVLVYRKKYFDTPKKKVLYTCLTGNYDTLRQHSCIDFEYDYICFTDNNRLLMMGDYGVWKIKPLQYTCSDNTRNSRWHKTHPHILFKDYDISIWVDSNVDIKDEFFFSNVMKNKLDKIKIPLHRSCNCIYKECKRVVRFNKELPENSLKIKKFLQDNHFPKRYGLNETNVIYRKHNDIQIVTIMEMWWYFINNYSKRDQLSLSYVLWKHGIKSCDIIFPNTHKGKLLFTFYSHK
jgi:hypothetical protein